MLKKKFLLLFIVPLFAHAQYDIGYNKSGNLRKISKLNDEELDVLKATTTAFVIPAKDSINIQQYELAIKSVWNRTPFIIIYPNEINRYSNKKAYSIFKFRVLIPEKVVDAPNRMLKRKLTAVYLNYELWVPDGKKNDKVESHIIAGIELYPDAEFLKKFYLNRAPDEKADLEKTLLNSVYKGAQVYSWGPGFLKGYLKTINDGLVSKNIREAGEESTDKGRLSSLKTDTLYVPQYVLTKLEKLTISDKENELDDESLASAYPYPVRFLPDEELNNLILDSSHPIKYLTFCRSHTEKYVNVYDSKDGSLIFSRGSFLSFNFKYRDLTKLSKAIE